MIKLKIKSKGDAVVMLQELLNEFGYSLKADGIFGMATDLAVRNFQKNNQLVADGIVYTKTWVKILNRSSVDFITLDKKYLQENDIVQLAGELGLEPAIVKAVNEVESSGRGFTVDGNPKILFEGHVFWNELVKRGINPNPLTKGNEDILYQKWTTKNYRYGKAEYERLNKAINLVSNNVDVTEAAYAAASWGLFQIMGYHFKSLGYKDIVEFVGANQINEGEHLRMFGKFIKVNGLVKYLKAKDWKNFAYRYNGSAYEKNKYDVKLKKAYEKYALLDK